MNTDLLSSDINEIKGIVNIVPYQINRTGKYPFLQYFLLKYNTNLEEQEDNLDLEQQQLQKSKYNDIMNNLKQSGLYR